MSEVYRPWKEVVVCFALCIGVASFGRGCSRPPERLIPPRPPSVMQAIEALQARHPDWRVVDADDPYPPYLRCYLISRPYPPLDRRWYTWPVLANDPVEKINQLPFEEKYWKNTVFVRLYQNADDKHQGWYGPVLIKGPFLFYGDQKMLRQIDGDLK